MIEAEQRRFGLAATCTIERIFIPTMNYRYDKLTHSASAQDCPYIEHDAAISVLAPADRNRVTIDNEEVDQQTPCHEGQMANG